MANKGVLENIHVPPQYSPRALRQYDDSVTFVLPLGGCIYRSSSTYYHNSMKLLLQTVLLSLIIGGCSSPFEGIRMRARAPDLDQAFRKIGIAVDLDGYTRVMNDPASRVFQTDWRVLRNEERPPEDRGRAVGADEARLTLKIAPRGQMYDVFLGVFVRSERNGAVQEEPVPADHPLAMKWRKVLNGLLERESREED